MNKAETQRLLEATFDAAFDEERFAAFAREWLDGMEYRDNQISGGRIYDAFTNHISSYKRIGKYTDPDGRALDVLVVRVKTPEKLDRARTSLRDFIIRHMADFRKDYALAAFYSPEDGGSDWRFSFIKLEYEEYLDEAGKVKTNRRETPAKRYSFLVGAGEKGHTAKRQLLDLMLKFYQPTVEQIEEAFSIETVTNEFFEQYKSLFVGLNGYLAQHGEAKEVLDAAELDTERFTKKLLGQIVFLYFLQKKGWLGAEPGVSIVQGKRRFIQELFERSRAEGKNFYNHYLKYLFYEALAQEREDNYYERFDCQIPFLNGGLFEAQHDWHSDKIQIPERFFRNQDTTQSGDVGTGILDVFDRYNFTIKEDEPLEKEVAVDPEMLGKVFENLLPENIRKGKGAFYTPRKIVHYMCQESLIHYLDQNLNIYEAPSQEAGSIQSARLDPNEGSLRQRVLTEGRPRIKVPRTDLETFIRRGYLFLENDRRVTEAGKETRDYFYKTPQTVRAHVNEIDKLLADIRICDPAVGSGAFPLGLLHEIVQARLLVQLFKENKGDQLTPYQLKRHTIEQSIYGVDIDASAIDIARLRLWLSMIVDEEVYDDISALPNLDYKLVHGDSLVGIPEDMVRNHKLEEEIVALKQRFIHETEDAIKKQLRQSINQKIKHFLKTAESFANHPIDFDYRLFFSEVWVEKGGFDVVIGNPPYVQIQKYSGKPIQEYWKMQNYDSFTKTGDLYCLFYEKGYRILRKKGVLAFITSNKWMRAAYGKSLRVFFRKNTSIHQLIDFGDSPIFSEATTYTNILLFERSTEKNDPEIWDLSSKYRNANSLRRMLEETQPGAPLFSDDAYIIASPQMAKIKKQIETIGTPLKDWGISIYRGILTGYNDAFIITGKEKDKLIAADPKSAEIIKPILRGRDIKRYHAEFADLWLIATFPALNLNIDDYPAVRDYLKSFGRKLYQTGEIIGKDENGKTLKSRKKTGNKWFETQDQIAYYKEFEKEKIIYAEIVFDSAFYYDTSGIYPEATSFVLTGESVKHLTAVLNSELLTFAFRAFYAGGDLRGDTFRYKKAFLQNLPVIKPEGQISSILEILVEYVQLAKSTNQRLQSAYYEQIIDGLVYELYFPKEFETASKQLSSHLANLTSLTGKMTKEEKLAVIGKEFELLYDPHHPVRNKLETLDSVEEVRIIKEALNK